MLATIAHLAAALLIAVSTLCAQTAPPASPGSVTVAAGEPALYRPFEITFDTAASAPGGLDERTPSPHHPWLDYRLQGWFLSPSGRLLSLPGFYAADGRGGDAGSVWKLRFTPDEFGIWVLFVQFEHGRRINVQDLSVRGTPLAPHGSFRLLMVAPRGQPRSGFHAHGPLEAVGGRYLRHRDGTWFLKTGANSPENFLAYAGFDGLRDHGGKPRGANFLHRYQAHVQDWRSGDPNWSSGGDPNAGKGIIGALNYLHEVGVNSIYFLPMNLGGDGQDVYPFIDGSTNSYYRTTHYDVGRLEQWHTVFGHAQELGILLEFVLAENERANIDWLGDGMTVQRRLFLKNMVAHFGCHLGLRWILCEENSPEPTEEFTVAELNAMAAWIDQMSSHRHPIAVHSDPDDQRIFEQILQQGAAGAWLTSASLQVHNNYNPSTEAAVALFQRYQPIGVIDLDEMGPASTGVSTSNHDEVRRLVLWDVLLSGGNVAWYCGYHALPVGGDIRLEDFRTRDAMWRYTKYARELLQTMPFWRMTAADDLVTGETRHGTYGDAEVFARPGQLYVVYFADSTNTGMIDLSAASSNASFEGRWYDPMTDQWLGSRFTRAGGGQVWLPSAPSPTWRDRVLVLRRR